MVLGICVVVVDRSSSPCSGKFILGDDKPKHHLMTIVQQSYRTILLGMLVSMICLFLAVWQVDLKDILGAVAGLHAGYLFLSVGSSFACFGVRAVRWRLLLQPIKAIPFRSLLSAELVGFMANNLLPLRMGEVVKSLAINRLEGVRVSAAMGTVAAGGLLNVMTLGMLLLAGLGLERAVELVGWPILAWCTTAVLALASLTVFLVMVNRRQDLNCKPVSWIFSSKLPRIERAVRGFWEGMRSLGNLRRALTVGLLSLMLWLCMAGRFFFISLAMGIPLSMHAAVVVQAIVGAGASLPSSPAQVGTFELSTVFGLQMFSIDKDMALACALLVRFVYFLPATIIGVACAWQIGLHRWPAWRREALAPVSPYIDAKPG